MHLKKIIPFLLIIIALLFSGCLENGENIVEYESINFFIPKPVDVSKMFNYSADLDDIVTGVKIKEIEPRKSVNGFSYLDSFSLMISRLENTTYTAEVFAAAGLGAPTICDTSRGNKNLRPMQGYAEYTLIRSMKNYNLNWVVGYAEDGEFSQYITDPYLEEAVAKLAYRVDNTSLDYLKSVLNTGRLVQVHIDPHCLRNYSIKFKNMSLGNSYYLVVTGYNETKIYLSDTYLSEDNKTEFEDIPIPIDVFIDAWYHGGRINSDENTTTYWMLFLHQRKYHNTIKKPSFNDIITQQKNLSKNLEKDFNTYISKINSGEYNTNDTSWSELANIKQVFAEYLRNNGYEDASNAYETLYKDYMYCNNNPEQIKDKLDEIKQHELTALSLLP